jgi:hypothetical protein
MKVRVFWNIEPCSLAGVDRRFRDAYCRYNFKILEVLNKKPSGTKLRFMMALREGHAVNMFFCLLS